MLFGRFTKPDILAETPETNRQDRASPRFSPSQIMAT